MITQHQLRWLGHVVRMPSGILPQSTIGQLHHGHHSAGGQKKRYKDQLKTALRKCKIRPEALEAVAADRNTWCQLCQDGTWHSGGGEDSQKTGEKNQKEHTYGCCCHHHHMCPTCNRTCGSRIELLTNKLTDRSGRRRQTRWTTISLLWLEGQAAQDIDTNITFCVPPLFEKYRKVSKYILVPVLVSGQYAHIN